MREDAGILPQIWNSPFTGDPVAHHERDHSDRDLGKRPAPRHPIQHEETMNSQQKQMMKKICRRMRSEEGNVLITAFIFLVILTLIGIFATRTAQMDLQIAANEIPYKRNFYIAEGRALQGGGRTGTGKLSGH
jgi:hypothetical protein